MAETKWRCGPRGGLLRQSKRGKRAWYHITVKRARVSPAKPPAPTCEKKRGKRYRKPSKSPSRSPPRPLTSTIVHSPRTTSPKIKSPAKAASPHELKSAPKAAFHHEAKSAPKSPPRAKTISQRIVNPRASSPSPRGNYELAIETIKFNPDDYEEVEVLGEGGAGRTILAREIKHPTKMVVIKKILRNQFKLEAVLKERAILRRLQPICKSYTVCFLYFGQRRPFFYLVTEFTDNMRDLAYAAWRAPIADPIKVAIAWNLIDGLRAIHSRKVAHRDVKPDNVLVNRETGSIRYIDFGVSCMDNDCEQFSTGTTLYTAPEIRNLMYNPVTNPYGLRFFRPFKRNREFFQRADIFALGLTLLELMYGEQIPDNRQGLNKLSRTYRTRLLKLGGPDIDDLLYKRVLPSRPRTTRILPSKRAL
jgi:hypothetical protein